MQLVDHGYEDRLIQRIEARRLIEARLRPRERAILCGYYRHGDTLREVGAVEGVGPERIRQIISRALRKLQKPATLPLTPPRFDLRATPPPGFEAAEFLRHQQRLIEKRRIETEELFERERAKLEAMLKQEGPKASPHVPTTPYVPKPPPPPAPKFWIPPTFYLDDQLPPLPTTLLEWHPKLTPAAPVNVEPWFDRSRPPTFADLQQIGAYAISYFAAIRTPLPFGSIKVGEHAAHIVCPRTADGVCAAMQKFAREVPVDAQFSVRQLPVPPGKLGVSVGNHYIGMRIFGTVDHQRLTLEATWHNP